MGTRTPSEMRGIREQYQLSRSEFARITGLGEATLHRWENGLKFQNVANDEYLRLLTNPANFEIVHLHRDGTPLQLAATAKGSVQPSKFRLIGDQDPRRREQVAFQMRKVG